MAGELVRPTPAAGQIRKFSTFELDFLAIYHATFDVGIFSDISKCDLSNGASFVSVAWPQKKLQGHRGRSENRRFLEISNFREISISGPTWTPRGRIFRHIACCRTIGLVCRALPGSI